VRITVAQFLLNIRIEIHNKTAEIPALIEKEIKKIEERLKS